MEQAKKRGPRTTKKQIEIIVEFLQTNNILLKGKLEPKEIAIAKQKWHEMSELLNSCGQGPIKTTEQWKKVVTCFDDLYLKHNFLKFL